MEDGSALSPQIANQLGQTAGNQLKQQQQHYIRALAKLADCPAHLGPTLATNSANSNSNSAGASALLQKSNINVNSTGQLGARAMALLVNGNEHQASPMECLRTKSLEQVMVEIPLDLLAFDQHNQLVLASRWHKHIDLVLARFRRQLLATNSPLLQTIHSSSAIHFQSSSSNFAPVDQNQTLGATLSSGLASELAKQKQEHQPRANSRWHTNEASNLDDVFGFDASRKPIRSARQLSRLIAALLVSDLLFDQPDERGKENHNNGQSTGQEASSHESLELLSAIYNARQDSWQALFGPELDSALLYHDSSLLGTDLATLMLRQRSPFSQCDLLIGLSRPSLSAHSGSQMESSLGSPDEQQLLAAGHELSQLLISERGHSNEMGLNDSQAIEEVNLFVRAFYKFHQQEITNSIINHYLMASSSGEQLSLEEGAGQQWGSNKSVHRQQELMLLHSLIEAFQDALINVPVLKTALIHSLNQVKNLARVFVGDKLAKLIQLAQADKNSPDAQTVFDNSKDPIISHYAEIILGNNSASMLPNFANFNGNQFETRTPMHELIGDQFNLFVNEIILRHEKVTSAAGDNDRDELLMDEQELKLHSTYLFQFDLSLLLQSLHGANQLDKELDQLRSVAISSPKFLRNTSSFQCIFKLSQNDDVPLNELDRLEREVCKRLTRVLANFVANGNVNRVEDSFEPLLDDCNTETRMNNDSQQTGDLDHHSVQLTENSQLRSCQRREMGQKASQQKPKSWPLFNLYSQQIATIYEPKQRWLINQIDNNQDSRIISRTGSAQRTRSRWPISPARLTFWANFVPTLNCSRTQPIQPTSLFHSRSSNSTLANLNLIFDCQNGPQSASSLLAGQVESIKLELETEVSRLSQMQTRPRNGQRNGDRQRDDHQSQHQNHHSPRMTNSTNSSSGSRLEDEASPELVGQASNESSESNGETVNEGQGWLFAGKLINFLAGPFAGSNSRHSDPNWRPPSALLSLWLIGGLMVCLILATGGYLLHKRYKTVRNLPQGSQEAEQTTGQSAAEQKAGQTHPVSEDPQLYGCSESSVYLKEEQENDDQVRNGVPKPAPSPLVVNCPNGTLMDGHSNPVSNGEQQVSIGVEPISSGQQQFGTLHSAGSLYCPTIGAFGSLTNFGRPSSGQQIWPDRNDNSGLDLSGQQTLCLKHFDSQTPAQMDELILAPPRGLSMDREATRGYQAHVGDKRTASSSMTIRRQRGDRNSGLLAHTVGGGSSSEATSTSQHSTGLGTLTKKRVKIQDPQMLKENPPSATMDRLKPASSSCAPYDSDATHSATMSRLLVHQPNRRRMAPNKTTTASSNLADHQHEEANYCPVHMRKSRSATMSIIPIVSLANRVSQLPTIGYEPDPGANYGEFGPDGSLKLFDASQATTSNQSHWEQGHQSLPPTLTILNERPASSFSEEQQRTLNNYLNNFYGAAMNSGQ